MNNIKKLKHLIFAVFVIGLIASCAKTDSEKEYGFPLIYMPQSTMFSGGSNLNYPVPGGTTLNPNYTIDKASGKINIILGVYRAGLQSLEEFSVDVYLRADTASQIVTAKSIADAELLPNDLISFPQSVTVAGGTREKTFILTVDGAKLNSNYATLSGKKLILAIGIKNPSKYELNKKLSTTIVIIDTKSFMPMPQ